MNTKELTGFPSIDQIHKRYGSFLENHPLIPNISIYMAYYLISKMEKREDAIECNELLVSTKELLSDVSIVAKALKRIGIENGQVVTVLTPNLYQSIVTFFACNKIGAICSFLNDNATTDEVEYYLQLFDSPLLVTYERSTEFSRQILDNTGVKKIIQICKEDLRRKGFGQNRSVCNSPGVCIQWSDLGELATSYKRFINPFRKGDAEALYLFTSGTTGIPKVVVLTNSNIISCGMYQKNTCHITSNGGKRKSLACVPFCYPYGFSTSVLTQMLDGIGIILAPTVSQENFGYYLGKNPNIVFGSPALLEMMIKNSSKDLDLSSLEYFISGGDFLQDTKYEKEMSFLNEHNSKGLL